MANKIFLQALYNSHLADLKDIFPETEDRFICPICRSEFTQQAILDEKLNDGHVWPDYIRKKSGGEIVKLQRVLLCKSCNSNAGSRGDKEMQVREKLKDNERAGIFGDRRIEIIQEPGEKPIYLQANVELKTGDTIQSRFSFSVDKKTGLWLRNNPMEQNAFLTIGDNEKFAVVIHPPHGLKPKYAPVGWITGAYLLAFYTFGYRYILNESLDIVRQYILDSFDDDKRAGLTIPKHDDFGITECKEHYYVDPDVSLAVPLDGKTLVHLRISFLNYHIRLPFHFIPTILMQILENSPDFEELAKRALQNDAQLFISVVCNKSNGHKCAWDYVLGKPITE